MGAGSSVPRRHQTIERRIELQNDSKEAGRLNRILGVNRNAVTNAVALAVAVEGLASSVSSTANEIEQRFSSTIRREQPQVNVGNRGSDTGRARPPVSRSSDTGSSMSRRPAEPVKAAAATSLVPAVPSGNAGWRKRVRLAERRAALVIGGVHWWKKASYLASDMQEHAADYLDSLPPVLTDQVGAELPRFVQLHAVFMKKSRAEKGLPPLEPEPAINAAAEQPAEVTPRALDASLGVRAASMRGGSLAGKVAVAAVAAAAPRRAASMIASSKGQFGPPKAAPQGLPRASNAGAGDSSKPAAVPRKAPTDPSVMQSVEEDGAEDIWTNPPRQDEAAAVVIVDGEKIDTSEAALKSMQALLSRCNGRTLPRPPWNAPQLTSFANWTSNVNWREFESYRNKAADLARSGKFAVHINASGNGYLREAFSTRLEPYEMAARWGAHPSSTTADVKQISAYPLGARQLTSLALAVEAALGKEGLNKMHIVLTIEEADEAAILMDIKDRSFYGFNRDRFLVLSAPRLPGFVWSDKKKTWIADTASPPQSLETGYAIKQLAWPEQAYRINSDGSKEVLKMTSCLSHLRNYGTDFLASYSVGDIGRLHPEEAFDMCTLAYMLKAAENDADCILQVTGAEDNRRGCVIRAPATVANAGLQHAVVMSKLRCQTPPAVSGMNQLRASGSLLAPTERWVFKLEPLSRALGGEPRTQPAWVWLPCMQMAGLSDQMPHATGALHPALELGDLLLRGGVRCSVFKAVQPYAVIDTPDTADALLRAVTAQDSNAGFRALAAKLAPKHKPLQFKVTAETTSNARFVVLFFAAATPNNASHSAFCGIAPILKAGADIVHVVTVVPNAGETARAQRLLATYGGDVNAFLEVYRHVELSEGRPFAERAEEIAEHYRANLIVMGTEALAAGGTGLGSNALALAKRVRVPLMILKPEAGRRIMIGASSKKVVAQVQTKEEPQEELEVTLAARPNGGQPEKPVGVRTLLAYETGAVGTSMVRFVSMLLRPDMDSLILARATGLAPGAAPPLTGAPAQLAIQSNMQTSAELGPAVWETKSYGHNAERRVVAGKGVPSMVSEASRDRCDILSLMVPPGKQLPQEVSDALLVSRCAVLLYRMEPGVPWAEERQ